MPDKLTERLRPVNRACRRVAFGILAGLCRRFGYDEIEARIAARPQGEQTAIVFATLAALAATSALFANFGVIGMLAFLLLVIVLVN